MAGAAPVSNSNRNLALRVMSALVLAPVALAAAYYGGWAFAIFWTIAAIAILWEWNALIGVSGGSLVFPAGAGALAGAAVIAERGRPVAAIFIVVLGALSAAIFVPADRRIWIIAGVGYGGALLMAAMILRADLQFGFIALVLLFAVVWTTDVFGYFGGRAFGGPKLAPAISPKKTWSGAIVGAIGAMSAGLLVAYFYGLGNLVAVALVALLLSAVSQIGDLAESSLKRRFGAKDASQLIPGHGGVMDRLDGFWAAALAAALIGVARGGFDAPAQGLMLW